MARMRRALPLVSLVLLGLTVPMAGCPSDDGILTEEEEDALRTLGPIGEPPPSPSNAWADDPAAIELGAWVFGDERIAKPDEELACADCHQPALGWSDDLAVSKTANDTDTPRHSQTLTNIAWQEYMFWNGRSDSMWAQAFKAINAVHAIDKVDVVTYMASNPDYVERYVPLFGEFPADPGAASEAELDAVLINCSKALEAFQRTLVSVNSPVDQYIAGDASALSDQELRGAKIFVGKGGCINCHSGPNLSDNWFHNIGLAPGADGVDASGGLAATLGDTELNVAGPWSDDPDWGADQIALLQQRVDAAGDDLIGAHKTPTLRDVNLRVRFGHNGDVQSLRAWIERYRDATVDPGAVGTVDEFYVPRDLSDDDITDLIAFLDALTGNPSSADVL